MNNAMPCITDSDEHRFEPSNLDHALAVEEYADTLMAECITHAGAAAINTENDLYDGDLLPSLMVEIASWTGGSISAEQQMRQLHNLLADALQAIAEKEVK